MTWNELLKELSKGKMPKVKRGDDIGTITAIRYKGKHKGCSVDFGHKWDDWFHAENTGDKRSKYMDELELVELMESPNE